MIKLLGAGLILCGGFYQRCRMLEKCRRERQALRELMAALGYLRQEISGTLTPLLRLLQRRGLGEYADAFFALIEDEYHACGHSLVTCWRHVVDELPLRSEEKQALATVANALSGEEAYLLRALQGAEKALEDRLHACESTARQENRLVTSLCLSGSAILIVMLL